MARAGRFSFVAGLFVGALAAWMARRFSVAKARGWLQTARAAEYAET